MIFVRKIRKYRDVADPAAEDIVAQVTRQADRLASRLAAVRQVVIVASGKGGVGKSALTANLAIALADAGYAVGAVDADLNGPSLARMLGAHGQQLQVQDDALQPAIGTLGIRLISSDLLLPERAPLRWRNPAGGPDAGAPAFLFQSVYEGGVLRELIADVAWGALDFLLVDAPPGTDKLDRLIQLLPTPPVVLLVGTPSQAARAVVARSATVAAESGAREIGLIVNFASHVCEKCGHESPLYEADSAEALAAEAGVALWGAVPFDRQLAAATDRGEPFGRDHAGAPAARAIRAVANQLERLVS